MRTLTFALALAALALTAACNRKVEKAETPPPAPAAPAPQAAPAPEPHIQVARGFRHEDALDVSGFYVPDRPTKLGGFLVTNIGVGAPSDFRTWEKGDRASAFGPILIQLEGDGGSNPVRVLPEDYSLEPGRITFRGRSEATGEVLFEGRFDPTALEQARAEGSSTGPIMRGRLKVGSAPAQDVALHYWLGD